MATQTKFPSVYTGTDPAFTNTANLGADDGSYCTMTQSPGANLFLVVSGFGFTIPAGATINSLQVTMERQKIAGAGEAPVHQGFSLCKVVPTASGGVRNFDVGNFWSSTLEVAKAPVPPDLFGTTWTAEEVNAATFGAAGLLRDFDFDGSAGIIDYVSITVDYTAAGGGGAPKQTLLGVG